MRARPRPPVFLESVFDDPAIVRRLVERHSPYHPVQRTFGNRAEYEASSGHSGDGPMIVAPNFRGNWAYDEPLVEGAGSILHHEPFVEAARKLFDGALVRPRIVYVNLTWQLPFDQGTGHTDVPAFRGIERTRYPIWLLQAMGHSGLFEAERIRIATAVAWFYEGSDGGFCYWPDGPEAPPRVHEGAIHNTAFVGDNDRMFHRVRPVGRREDGMLGGMTLDTRLEHEGGDAWRVADGEDTRARLRFDALRISLSWKAEVFRDASECALVDAHTDDLTLDDVFARFRDDLEPRGVPWPAPSDPFQDPALVTLLAHHYITSPSSTGG